MMYNNKCPACGSKNIKIQSQNYKGLIDSNVVMYCHNCCTEIRTYGKTVSEAVYRYNLIADKEMIGRKSNDN